MKPTREIKANIHKGIRRNGERMDFETSVTAFNLFVLVTFGWFYWYFQTMIKAVLDVNDKLIAQLNGEKETTHDDMQMKLDNWLNEEE